MNGIATTQWYMVTNHLNLNFMLASGLILPRSGFGDKYFRDPLHVFPGYIPLFPDPVPGSAIEMATNEADHLIGVAAPVNLKEFTGKIGAVDTRGRLIRELSYPGRLSGEEAVLLIPAPLPATWLATLYFDTRAAVQKFKKQVKDYSNVCIDNLALKPLKKIFKNAGPGSGQSNLLDTPWYHAGECQRNVSLDLPSAAGGLMALAFHLADQNGLDKSGPDKNGSGKNQSSRSAFDHAFGNTAPPMPEMEPGKTGKPCFTDRPLAWLVAGTQPSQGASLTENMFWGIARAIADKSAIPHASARDRALDFLENQCLGQRSQALDPRLTTALEGLIRDLDGLDRGNSDFTRSQLFDRHAKPFPRAVILFFLHRDTPGMIENDNEKLTPEDVLAANLLVWAHRGWMGLPPEIKQGTTLAAAVTHKMAALAHTLSKTGIHLGPAPEPPIPFPDLFAGDQADGSWNKNQEKAALALAKALKWDCISTAISLGNGDYQLKSTTGGVTLILNGLEKGISHHVNGEKFFNALAGADIPGKQYNEVRTIMGCPR